MDLGPWVTELRPVSHRLSTRTAASQNDGQKFLHRGAEQDIRYPPGRTDTACHCWSVGTSACNCIVRRWCDEHTATGSDADHPRSGVRPPFRPWKKSHLKCSSNQCRSEELPQRTIRSGTSIFWCAQALQIRDFPVLWGTVPSFKTCYYRYTDYFLPLCPISYRPEELTYDWLFFQTQR